MTEKNEKTNNKIILGIIFVISFAILAVVAYKYGTNIGEFIYNLKH